VRIEIITVALLSFVAGPAAAQERRPPPPPGSYSIEQATSDRAQLHTIAFDGLAFLTGSFGRHGTAPVPEGGGGR